MNIEAFLLCDCATDSQGKLNVLGAFDRLYVQSLPVVHPACTIAARIRFSRIEKGEHNIRINIIDQDGKSIVPGFENSITVRCEEGSESSIANLALHLQRVKLENYGEYRIDLAIDGRQEATLPFTVMKAPAVH